MKTLFSFLLLFIALQLAAQDTLCLVNGKIIPASVRLVTLTDVLYRSTDTANKKEITIPKTSVRYILYSSGRYEITSFKNISPQEMNFSYQKGEQDANKCYHAPCGAVGTGIASFATGGIFGLVPAVICSSVKPKTSNLGLPKEAPVSDKSYMLGYVATAKKIKKRKVWRGYLIGTCSAIALALVLR